LRKLCYCLDLKLRNFYRPLPVAFMSFSKRRTLLTTAAFFLIGASAAPACAESLQDAVISALNTHPSVEAAIAARNAAIEAQEEQFAGYFPRLRASAATGRVYGDNSTSRGLSVTRGSGYSWNHEGSVTLTQMLFDGFRVENRVDAARARRGAANKTIVDVREQLSLQAALAYLSVLRAGEEKAVIEAFTEKIDDYVKRIESMVNEGAANEAELQQARDMRIMLDTVRIESDGRLEVARANYAEVVGNFPRGDLTLPIIDPVLIPEQDAAIHYALDHHPALGVTLYRAEAAENEIDVEKGALYPELNAELSYLKRDLRDVIGGEVVDAKGLLRMNWNFSTGGEQLSKISRRKYEAEGQRARVEEVRRQIEKDVRTAFAELETSRLQNETYVRREILMSDLAGTNRTQFEGGIVSLLQLLQSENQLFSAQLDRIGAKYRLLSARFGALASLGKLQTSLNIVPATHVTAKTTDQTNADFAGEDADAEPGFSVENGETREN